GRLGWGDDFTGISPCPKSSLQAKARRPGLVDHMQLLWRANLGQHLQKLGNVVRHLAYQLWIAATGQCLGHRDAVLVDIQADVNLDKLFHGRSPFAGWFNLQLVALRVTAQTYVDGDRPPSPCGREGDHDVCRGAALAGVDPATARRMTSNQELKRKFSTSPSLT